MSRWETLVDSDAGDFLDSEQRVKDCKSVEVIFDDGSPTMLVIELKDGNLVSFSSKETDYNGCRKELFVSTTKETE